MSSPSRFAARLPKLALLALAAALLVLHVAAVFTENINWDEFALVHRVAEMVRTGQLQGGSRPGLVELVLAPIVQGCRNTVETVQAARLLWVAITTAYVAGFFVLLLQARRREGARAWQGAALGVALLVLVPVFQRWSLQVRTDQAALACGMWGSVALLRSRRHPGWALAAGLLFGVGFLFTQKLVYVAALGGLLAAADHLERAPGAFDWRRELRRLLLAGVAAAAVWIVYRHVLSPLFGQARLATLSSGMGLFAYYRERFGFRAYVGMLPTLVPHLALGVLLGVATARSLRRPEHRRALALAWALLALGTAVGLFHAAAFPYFWMTLGLFPAAALAVAYEPVLELLPAARQRRLATAGLWLWLTASGLIAAVWLLEDTQRVQRDSFAFIERNFPRSARGFQAEGALACRWDPEPFRVYFSDDILRHLHGPEGPANVAALERAFRSRPVQFIVETHVMPQFPKALRTFWREHYQLYSGRVFIPGFQLSGAPGDDDEIDVLVPGPYRLYASAQGDASILVDGQRLSEGGTVTLSAGTHRVELEEALPAGLLVLAVEDPPAPSPEPFYSPGAIGDIIGRPFR